MRLKTIFSLTVIGLILPFPLSAQVRLEGRLVGPDGAPVSGGLVAAAAADSVSKLAEIPLARTDAAGRFVLETVPGTVGLTATAVGFRPYFRSLEVKSGQTLPPLELRLEKGGERVRGLVLDSRGQMTGAVRLAFAKIDVDGAFFAPVKEGKFEIDLDRGHYFFHAEAEKRSPVMGALTIDGPVEMKPLALFPEPGPAGPKVRQWIKSRAVPLRTVEPGRGFEDLQPLKNIIGDARVVALGEATHGTRDFFQLKHRLFEFLAEEMDFSVFGIEASLANAFAVNDYILTGRGDPAETLAGLGYWTCNTEEVLDLIKWMRRYNQDPFHRRKIKFYGFDMNNPLTAYNQVKEWLGRKDPEGAKILEFDRKALFSSDRAKDLKTASERLIARLDSRKTDFIRDEGEEAFERQRRNLRLLVQWAEKLTDPFGGVAARDEAMAANVNWIREREPGAKIVLWAHNSHVGVREKGMIFGDPMGWHLRRALGKEYIALGFAFREGGFIAMDAGPDRKGLAPFAVDPNRLGTLDEALASTGHDLLALDLRRLPREGPERSWFDQPQGTWHIGSVFNLSIRDAYIVNAPVAADYDAVLFVARTTAAISRAAGAGGGGGSRGARKIVPAAAYTNLGFEDGAEGEHPPGWNILLAQTYDVLNAGDDPKEGRRCLKIVHNGKSGGQGWMNFSQVVRAEPYQGKKIRLTGWIRADGRPGNEGRLWVRADLELNLERSGFFENMKDRPVTSAKWTKAVIEGVVDLEAKALYIGGMVHGTGTVWFDDITLEIIEPKGQGDRARYSRALSGSIPESGRSDGMGSRQPGGRES